MRCNVDLKPFTEFQWVNFYSICLHVTSLIEGFGVWIAWYISITWLVCMRCYWFGIILTPIGGCHKHVYIVNTPPPFFFNLFLLEPSYMGLLLESGMAGLLDHLTFVGHWLHPTGVSLWITSQDVSTWSAGTITYCRVTWQCLWAAVDLDSL